MEEKITPAEVERRAREGFQATVAEVAAVTRRNRASLYRGIHRKEIEAVWFGSSPRLTPAATLRLLGVAPEVQEPIAA